MAIRMSINEYQQQQEAAESSESAARHDELYQAHQRIQQLEQLNATLAAEVDRLRREYDEEVTEFNDGYEAAEQGLPDTSEPSDMKHDVWKCGYAWGMYPVLIGRVKPMEDIVRAARDWYYVEDGDSRVKGSPGEYLAIAVGEYEEQVAARGKDDDDN